MRAAHYHGPLDVRVEEIADPPPPSGRELRLRILRAGICGTDAKEFKHGPLQIPLYRRHPGSGHMGPITLGHEFVGRVEEAGAHTEGFAVGDRVVPGAGMWCGECPWCLTGQPNLCARYYTLGLHADGGLAEFANVPAQMCRPVPDDCSDTAAALAQPYAVALHALRRARPEPGQTVALIGVGGIGFFLLAGALAHGASRVIAVDTAPRRVARARALRAENAVLVSEDDAAASILDLTSGAGADLVIEASGAPPGPELARRAVRRGGKILLVGIQAEQRALDLADLTRREIIIIPSNAHVCDVDLPEALELLRDNQLAATAVERVIPLGAVVEQGLAPLSGNRVNGKILLHPGQEIVASSAREPA